MHLSLMRSCSAWPSGIWIDGDCRTAPDGSSFAWQHWSHTFEYALASGPGDWRAAGYSLAAEDYNHELLTVTTPPSSRHETGVSGRSDAVKPGVQYVETATGSGHLSVEPATVTLGALKPRGNPLAAGRTGALTGGDTVTVRLRETSGRPVTARVRFPGVSAAWLTDPLEESDGAPLRVEDDAVFVDLPAFGTATVVARGDDPPQTPPAPGGAARPPDPPWPVQPVYTRYWLHGKGPAPAGNLPVAVHLSPDRITLNPPGAPAAGPAVLCLTVAGGPAGGAGEVTLDVPPGLAVARPDGTPAGPLSYSLGERGWARWDLLVAALPGTRPGRYFVAARTADDLGQLLEDTVLVTV